MDPDPAYHFDADPDFYLMRMRIQVTKMMRIRIHNTGTEIHFVFVTAVKSVPQPPAAAAAAKSGAVKAAQQARPPTATVKPLAPEFMSKKERREESRRKRKVSQISQTHGPNIYSIKTPNPKCLLFIKFTSEATGTCPPPPPLLHNV
jgi:hypothetical protein